MPLTSSLLAHLRSADKLSYEPHPREFLRNAPTRALLIIVDGVTPNAMKRARTPTFDMLNARGVFGADARSIFPTITGPAHTSILTGARVGAHGFLYPEMLDAYSNRLLGFTEGLMQAQTIAEAWRPHGLTTVAIGSRFMRGADASVTEGILGEDLDEITRRAVAALHDWDPHFLMVVFYAADTMGHLFGPNADETLAAIEEIDARVGQIFSFYADKNLLDETAIAVVADHGMSQVDEVVSADFVEHFGALAHGRLAFVPRKLTVEQSRVLLKDPRVDRIFTRTELELLGAWNPRWGEAVIHLEEGLMFPRQNKMQGYHGAWSETEQRVPLFLSGAGIRANATLTTCEIVDLAPTLSVMLGGDIPQQAEGRVLWEALDMEDPPESDGYIQLIRERDELIGGFKQAKKEWAEEMLSAKEFSTQRAQLNKSATHLLAEIRKQSARMRKNASNEN